MGWDDVWNFGAEDDPAYRKKVLEAKLLAPLGISLTTKDKIGDIPESPAEVERKRAQVKQQLEKHDALFGVYPGCTIEDRYKLPRNVSAGDPHEDGLDDADAELASMDAARR